MMKISGLFICVIIAESLFFGLHAAFGDQTDLNKLELPKCPIGENGAPMLADPGIPSGGKCRGTCGVDCARCESIDDIVVPIADYGDSQLVCVYPNAIECKTHQGCRDHDACYDRCAEQGNNSLIDECHRNCDQSCFDRWGVGQCAAWADVMPSSIQTGYEHFVAQPEFDGTLKYFWGEPKQMIVPYEIWRIWGVINDVKTSESEIKLARAGNSLTFINPSQTCSGVINGTHFGCQWKSYPAGEPQNLFWEIDFSPEGRSFAGVYKGVLEKVHVKDDEGERDVPLEKPMPFEWSIYGERIS